MFNVQQTWSKSIITYVYVYIIHSYMYILYTFCTDVTCVCVCVCVRNYHDRTWKDCLTRECGIRPGFLFYAFMFNVHFSKNMFLIVFAWSSESMTDLELGKHPWTEQKGTDTVTEKKKKRWTAGCSSKFWPCGHQALMESSVEPTVGNDATVIIWPTASFTTFCHCWHLHEWYGWLISKTIFIYFHYQ